MTIATSMRALVASIALGLQQWVGIVLQDTSRSDYWIGGEALGQSCHQVRARFQLGVQAG